MRRIERERERDRERETYSESKADRERERASGYQYIAATDMKREGQVMNINDKSYN